MLLHAFDFLHLVYKEKKIFRISFSTFIWVDENNGWFLLDIEISWEYWYMEGVAVATGISLWNHL